MGLPSNRRKTADTAASVVGYFFIGDDTPSSFGSVTAETDRGKSRTIIGRPADGKTSTILAEPVGRRFTDPGGGKPADGITTTFPSVHNTAVAIPKFHCPDSRPRTVKQLTAPVRPKNNAKRTTGA